MWLLPLCSLLKVIFTFGLKIKLLIYSIDVNILFFEITFILWWSFIFVTWNRFVLKIRFWVTILFLFFILHYSQYSIFALIPSFINFIIIIQIIFLISLICICFQLSLLYLIRIFFSKRGVSPKRAASAIFLMDCLNYMFSHQLIVFELLLEFF